MVTGTSTAQLAIVLVDARHGLLEQSRRHAFLASLLGIQHIVLAVNKMDLIDWDQEQIREDPRRLPRVRRTPRRPRRDHHPAVGAATATTWSPSPTTRRGTTGPALLSHLEEVYIAGDRNLVDVRFPVQYVIRPQTREHADHRSYAGTVASGVMRPGDEVVVLPTGKTSRITAIEGPSGPVAEAFPPMAVSVSLADDIDISRGDMIARPNNQPRVDAGVRRHGVLDGRRGGAGAGPRLHHQAHHPHHPGQGDRAGLPARRQHAAPRQDAQRR